MTSNQPTEMCGIAEIVVVALLSGSVDSSLTTATMASFRRDPTTAISVGFTDQTDNELPYACMFADRGKTECREHLVDTISTAIIPRWLWA